MQIILKVGSDTGRARDQYLNMKENIAHIIKMWYSDNWETKEPRRLTLFGGNTLQTEEKGGCCDDYIC